MTKSIILSVRPEWVAKILNGEKTIEIRRNAPKCDLPIDVYIYCTKAEGYLQKCEFYVDDELGGIRTHKGFIVFSSEMPVGMGQWYWIGDRGCLGLCGCDEVIANVDKKLEEQIDYIESELYAEHPSNGMAVARFTLYKVEEIHVDPVNGNSYFTDFLTEQGLLDLSSLTRYRLHEYLDSGRGYAWYIQNLIIFDEPKPLSDFGLTKAPQSWQYVEVVE